MICSGCGRKARNNETFCIFVNSTPWWLTLMDEGYCNKCAVKKREEYKITSSITLSSNGMKAKKVGKASSKGKHATPCVN